MSFQLQTYICFKTVTVERCIRSQARQLASISVICCSLIITAVSGSVLSHTKYIYKLMYNIFEY